MTRILIVEDDSYISGLYREVVESGGYEVETAEDGKEALEKVETFGPDLILLDLMIPYIDGFNVLQTLRGNEATKEIKVVVLTNLDSETQKEKAIKLGADRFLVKTSNTPDVLLEEVKKVIQ